MPKIQIKLREAVKSKRVWWKREHRVVPAKSSEELAHMCVQAAEYIDLIEKQRDESMAKLNELRIRVAKVCDTLKE